MAYHNPHVNWVASIPYTTENFWGFSGSMANFPRGLYGHIDA